MLIFYHLIVLLGKIENFGRVLGWNYTNAGYTNSFVKFTVKNSYGLIELPSFGYSHRYGCSHNVRHEFGAVDVSRFIEAASFHSVASRWRSYHLE